MSEPTPRSSVKALDVYFAEPHNHSLKTSRDLLFFPFERIKFGNCPVIAKFLVAANLLETEMIELRIEIDGDSKRRFGNLFENVIFNGVLHKSSSKSKTSSGWSLVPDRDVLPRRLLDEPVLVEVTFSSATSSPTLAQFNYKILFDIQYSDRVERHSHGVRIYDDEKSLLGHLKFHNKKQTSSVAFEVEVVQIAPPQALQVEGAAALPKRKVSIVSPLPRAPATPSFDDMALSEKKRHRRVRMSDVSDDEKHPDQDDFERKVHLAVLRGLESGAFQKSGAFPRAVLEAAEPRIVAVENRMTDVEEDQRELLGRQKKTEREVKEVREEMESGHKDITAMLGQMMKEARAEAEAAARARDKAEAEAAARARAEAEAAARGEAEAAARAEAEKLIDFGL